MMEVSRHCTKEELCRLQAYAKTIAPSLRFLRTQYLFNEYVITFTIKVEEYNAINEIEYKIDEAAVKLEEKRKKEEWSKLSIFKKLCILIKKALK